LFAEAPRPSLSVPPTIDALRKTPAVADTGSAQFFRVTSHRVRSPVEAAVFAMKDIHMDKEHLKGVAKDAEGKLKEAAGKLLGDKSLEVKGKIDQVEGEAHKTLGDIKDAVKE
jgi:uncharacterized protein YjbJ (UPF0337 family)